MPKRVSDKDVSRFFTALTKFAKSQSESESKSKTKTKTKTKSKANAKAKDKNKAKDKAKDKAKSIGLVTSQYSHWADRKVYQSTKGKFIKDKKEGRVYLYKNVKVKRF